MEQFESVTQAIALSMGAAWASGLNLYATLLVLGFMASSGGLVLPESLAILSDPLVLMAAAFMYFVEFCADKIPGVDSGWDTLHTFIRIPAGAALAAGMLGDVNPAIMMAAAIVGGGVAATSHTTKAGTRLMLNTSPEPMTNWSASLTEDVAVIGGLWAALHYPAVFVVLLILFFVFAAWLLPKIFRFIKLLWTKVANILRRKPKSEDVPQLPRE